MGIENDTLDPSWDAMAPPTRGGNRGAGEQLSLFMKFNPRPEPYHFRLACTPISFRKHGWAFKTLRQWPISPAGDRSERDLDIAWKEGYYIPGEKYAAFVFDRDNNNRVRIVEDGREVFGPIYNQGQLSKCNPASATKGWDWIVQVSEAVEKGPDGKDRKVRKYLVSIDTSKGATPFTDEEIKALENPKFQRSELETRYFVKATPEHIKELWLALPEALRKNPKKEAKGGQQKTAESKPADAKPTTPAATAAPTASSAKPAASEAAAETNDNTFLNDGPSEEPTADGDDTPAARLF